MEDLARIYEVLRSYNQQLYQSSHPDADAIQKVVDNITSSPSEDDKQVLDRPFIEHALQEAVFSMGSLKAPSPDGYSTGFY